LLAVKRDPAALVSDARARRALNRWVIVGGLALPLASILAVLSFGIPAGHRMLPLAPGEGVVAHIDVTGRQWQWDVRYPGTNVALVDELHIPAGVPVDIHVRTEDVIHSFWVPRLAGKIDAIPGRVNVLRLEAN